MSEAAAPRFLLDTNILSDLVRRPQGIVAARIAAVGEASICTSIVVAAELRFGAVKSESRRLRAQVDAVLAVLDVLSLAAPVDVHYADIRHKLERSGTPVGPNDMLIAAHARSMGCIVVTANLREFRRVPRLKAENWLADQGDR
ncbi:MAG TPA: type II toxin-antitoxin system VapC family toxin [Rhodanobacteraceae bacterium]|nr:type II toxin-antitoxin system VapC family toxin [Rhodanobacteraceae bacterium]